MQRVWLDATRLSGFRSVVVSKLTRSTRPVPRQTKSLAAPLAAIYASGRVFIQANGHHTFDHFATNAQPNVRAKALSSHVGRTVELGRQFDAP